MRRVGVDADSVGTRIEERRVGLRSLAVMHGRPPAARTILGDARIEAVLDRLHAEAHDDALDREKAEYCYVMCRALGARHVLEAGTSFGISTIHLAAAVRENGGGSVIATEYEPAKAAIARRNFADAGVAHFIDLREGDLIETLRHVETPIDFALIDISAAMALPAFELIAPRLRPGALVACDGVAADPAAYADYRAVASDPGRGFIALTVPYPGGLHIALKIDGLPS